MIRLSCGCYVDNIDEGILAEWEEDRYCAIEGFYIASIYGIVCNKHFIELEANSPQEGEVNMIPEKGIAIEWLTATHSCDTCGTSFSEGARVYMNGKVIIDLRPSAHCYNSQTYDRDYIYKEIFTFLGYNLFDVNYDS